jgi:hypothetical protein
MSEEMTDYGLGDDTPIESYEQLVERHTAEAEASATLSQSQIDQEIAALRASAAFNSRDPLVRGPAIDRMMELTSGKPVASKPSADNPQGSDIPDNVYDQLEPEAQELVTSEAALRAVWHGQTEERLTEIATWVDGLDAQLGNQAATNALYALGVQNDPTLARIVSAGLRGEPDVVIRSDQAKSLIEKLSNPRVMKASPVIGQILQGALEQLFSIAYSDDVASGDPLRDAPKSPINLETRLPKPGETEARYWARRGGKR